MQVVDSARFQERMCGVNLAADGDAGEGFADVFDERS